MQILPSGTWGALCGAFSKLAFWRKAPTPVADESVTEVALAAVEAKRNEAAPAPAPTLLARFKLLFRRKPKTSDIDPLAAAPDVTTPADTTVDDADAPEPKPTLMARFKSLLRRRRTTQNEGATEDEGTATDNASDDAAEAEAPKSFAQKLRSKRVWIPALAVLLLSLIGGVVALMLRSSHETERLQKELQAAKHKLEQQHTAALHPPAPAHPPAATHPATVEPPKVDPAFNIVGAKPAPEAESGINAGDCVVSDREHVAANLKRCIEAFNATVATSTKKQKP